MEKVGERRKGGQREPRRAARIKKGKIERLTERKRRSVGLVHAVRKSGVLIGAQESAQGLLLLRNVAYVCRAGFSQPISMKLCV